MQCEVGDAQETLSTARTSMSVVLAIREGDVFRVGTVAVEPTRQ